MYETPLKWNQCHDICKGFKIEKLFTYSKQNFGCLFILEIPHAHSHISLSSSPVKVTNHFLLLFAVANLSGYKQYFTTTEAEQRTWTIRKRLWSSAPSLVSNNHWRAKKMSRGDVRLWCRKRLNVEWTSWTTIISKLGNFIRLVYRCFCPIRGLPFSAMFHFHSLESNRQRGCVMRWSTPDELTPLELPISIWYILLSVNNENHLSPLNSLLLEFSHQKKQNTKADDAGTLKQNKPCDLMRRDGKPISEERLCAMSEL